MHLNTGDTAWLLASAALVLFMTPGLALFYGGMVNSRNVLTIMMQNFIAIAVITVTWILFGYSFAFNKSVLGGFIGLPSLSLGLSLNPVPAGLHLAVPAQAYLAFELMFAIITGALITGAVAERMNFLAYVLFIVLWSIVIYCPIAHWAFSPEGWLNSRGMLDFAGGTVVEINSGFSALGLLIAVGPRLKWPKELNKPHSIPISLAGAGIIWFGWFGFNAGSAIDANASAAVAFLNTELAAATGLLGWIIFERFKQGYATTLGAASGAIAGMVAVTPAAGYVEPYASLLIGLAAGVLCALFVNLKHRFKLDDSLDVLGVHGIGGIIGTLLVGFFATTVVYPAGTNGLFIKGSLHLLIIQILGVICTCCYAFLMSFIIAKLIQLFVPLRVSKEVELSGLDLALHAESAYFSREG